MGILHAEDGFIQHPHLTAGTTTLGSSTCGIPSDRKLLIPTPVWMLKSTVREA